jgi:hypothetical protein
VFPPHRDHQTAFADEFHVGGFRLDLDDTGTHADRERHARPQPRLAPDGAWDDDPSG